MRVVVLTLVALVVAGPEARAQRLSGGGELTLATRAATEVAPAGERVWQGAGLATVRALLGHRFAYAASFGFELGADVPAGFGYAMRLSPVGGAFRFGRRNWFGLTAGLGGSGVIDRLPIALELPVTLFGALDVGERVRVSMQVRAAWVTGPDARDDGSPTAPFADELDAEIGVAVGKRERYGQSHWSDGTYVGVFVREQQGRRIVGLSLAVAISGAVHR